MHKDRIAGSTKKLTGAIKTAVGKVTGDDRLQAEGLIEKKEGAIQNRIGKAKDAAKSNS